MSLNDFIFEPGAWIGEGKITFSASPEFIKFYTRWQIEKINDKIFQATQVVEMVGIPEKLNNTLTITDIKPHSFSLILQNNTVSQIHGKGIRDDKTIAWEFRGQEDFEGFEVYEKQENGDYFMHAEYGAPEQYRTMVEGLIWRKA